MLLASHPYFSEGCGSLGITLNYIIRPIKIICSVLFSVHIAQLLPNLRPQISHEERLLLPPNIADGFLPLSITSIDRLIGRPEEVAPLLKRYKKDEYVMAVAGLVSSEDRALQWPRMPWSRPPGPELRLSLR